MKTLSSTPSRSQLTSCTRDSPLRNLGWYTFGVPGLICLLATFVVIVVLDVFYAPTNGIHTPLHKFFPRNGWSGYEDVQRSFQSATYGASKPVAVVASGALDAGDKQPSGTNRKVSDWLDDSVPVELASSGDSTTRSSAEDTAKRSSTTLQDSESLVWPLQGSQVSSSTQKSSSTFKEVKKYTEDDMNALLSGEGKLFGKVVKKGMLPTEKWIPPKDHKEVLKPINNWLWNALLGSDDGHMPILPAGESPPKAGICTLLFNPTYKFIVVKNTKVAGTSLFLKFGGFCPPGITLEKAKAMPNCLWRVSDITRNGLEKLGYSSFEEMWADYSVLALVRNPYDRAGSSYDYTLGRRQNRTGDCRDPTFEHYTSKPYVIGLQDTLFSCSDAIHDFYHVEPQHTCLLDAQSNLVIDWVVRINSIEQDLKPAIFAFNKRRLPGAPRLKGGIGWEQRGPLADDLVRGGERKADTSTSRHASKFARCGAPCIHNVNEYYRKDFELLQYPVEVVNS